MANMPPPRPQQHYQESPQYAAPPPSYVNGLSGNDIAGKAIEAYKINPMLTGLLFLNLAIFVGAGWYLNVVQDRTAMYVKARDQDLKDLQNKALDMASKCVVPDIQAPRYAPQPQYYPQSQYTPAPEHPQYVRPIQPVPPPAPAENVPAALPPRQTPRTVPAPSSQNR